MVRTRLTVLILVLLGTVLAVSVALVWTVSRAQYHLERSQISHDELDAYHAVAEAAYRHFKQLGDLAISGGKANEQDLADTAAQLRTDLDSLMRMTQRESAFVDSDKRLEETQEISGVAALAQTINSVLEKQRMLATSLREGGDEAQRSALVSLMEDEIDGKLRHEIDAAIADEADEVRRADEATRVLLAHLVVVAGCVTLVGLLLAAAAIHFLSARVRAPMGELMAGVAALSEGHLNHRTRLTGKDEFAQLGRAMDDMASRLESQREELLEARSGLEQTVAARTEQLARANTQLMRVDTMRQEFLANISHELRTPITVIRGEADVTLRGGAKPVRDYTDALTLIVEQARRLAKLVDDLLLIARAKADALRLDLRPIPLEALLAEAAEQAEALSDKETRVVLTTAHGGPAALGDRDRLMQLFMILLDNAVRYSGPDHTVRVAVRGEGGRVTVEIRDDGVGMSPEDLETVFERYYRGETGRRMSPQGSGLGLHIAQAIVTAHRGKIRIDSALGQGTTVTVTLPAAARLKASA